METLGAVHAKRQLSRRVLSLGAAVPFFWAHSATADTRVLTPAVQPQFEQFAHDMNHNESLGAAIKSARRRH